MATAIGMGAERMWFPGRVERFARGVRVSFFVLDPSQAGRDVSDERRRKGCHDDQDVR